MGPQARLLPDGRRLYLSHGPIDLVIETFGPRVGAAYAAAEAAFEPLLEDLVAELPLLRQPIMALAEGPRGPVARRMAAAGRPFGDHFVTPMAAVAGAVADHILAAMGEAGTLDRAYVNNGGDIAFSLTPGTQLRCGLVSDLAAPALDGGIVLSHDLPARGIATSGRLGPGQGGRSFSLGIADSVTVLAADAARADVAATLIANAVDLPGHPAVRRRPARDLDPDSDLGERAVTLEVGPLTAEEIDLALASGLRAAQSFHQTGLIHGALLSLRGRSRAIGPMDRLLAAA